MGSEMCIRDRGRLINSGISGEIRAKDAESFGRIIVSVIFYRAVCTNQDKRQLFFAKVTPSDSVGYP